MNNQKFKTLSKNLVVVRNNKRKANSSKKSKKSQLIMVPYKQPVSIGYTMKAKAMKVSGKSTSKGVVVTVKHCEYVKDVVTPSNYNGGLIILRHSVQPGLKAEFPWLSKMGLSFESYQFKGIRYTYKPSVGTTVNGTIFAAAQYDINSPAPESKTDLIEIQGSKESPVYKMLDFNLSTGKGGISNQKTYKIRSTSQVTGDLELYDTANFYLGFNGISVWNGSSVANALSLRIGEIWVEYIVDFVIPVGKTSQIQIGNIESLYGGSTFNGAQTAKYFLGNNLISKLAGKLKSAGLEYFEDIVSGAGNGYNFFTYKTINKLLRFVQTVSANTPNLPQVQLLSWRQGGFLLDEDNNIEGSNENILDGQALITAYDTSSNYVLTTPSSSFTLSSFSLLSPTSRGVVMTDYVTSNTQISSSFLVRALAGDIINFYGLGSGVPTANCHFYMTDYDTSQAMLAGMESIGDEIGD